MIPIGAPYTSFEKMFRPFHMHTWIAVILLYLAATTFITVIRCIKSKIIRNMVFGTRNQRPYLNMVEVFLGGTLKEETLPTKNFARTLLMIFILYSLIIRTVYQGSLVRNLQSENRKPSVANIDEMIEKSYTFYLKASRIEFIEQMPGKNMYSFYHISILSRI